MEKATAAKKADEMSEKLKAFAAKGLATQKAVDETIAKVSPDFRNKFGPGKNAQIQLSQIRECPFNPRKSYGAIDELAESVAAVGILQALWVRPVDGEKGGQAFELVFGHRRFRAAKKAELALVPCEIRELTDAQSLEAQLAENVQREALTPLEEGLACEHLMKIGGYDADQVAERVAKTRGWVYGRLKLTNLGPEARKAFNDGRLTDTSVLLCLARVPQALQGKALLQIAPKGYEPPTARRAIEFLQHDFCRQLRNAPFDLKDDLLVPAAGSCTKCPKNSRNVPELFGDFDRDSAGGTSGVCSDLPCYQKKVEEHARVQTVSLVAAGAKEAPKSDAPQFFGSGGLIYNSPWVLVDEPMGSDAKKRTWRQILSKIPEGKRPQVYVSRKPDGEVVQLHKRADAVAAAADLGLAFAKVEAKQEAQEQKERKKHREQRDEKKIRLEVVYEVAERIAAQVEAKGPTVREWRWLALAYLATRNVDRILERRELAREKLDDMIESKGDAAALASFLAECVADDLGAACHNEYPEDFRSMAKSYQLDVDRLEQLRDQRKAEKKAKREEKKKGAA